MKPNHHYKIGEDLLGSLQRYVELRIETGGFLRAILENDLVKACDRADLQNRGQIFHIVSFIYNNLPRKCWGSPEKVAAWLKGEPEGQP